MSVWLCGGCPGMWGRADGQVQNSAMLQVLNASVFYASRNGHAVHALDDISFDIPLGGCVVALGASGCGKSTLLHAMAGFLPLSQGRIMLNGRAITEPGADRGVIFQKDALLPWKNVHDNIALGLAFAGVTREARDRKTRELLGLVGLQNAGKTPSHELSGGMRQRVELARALATDPQVLLMDEPFGALDSLTRERMQELLASVWAKTHKQIFFITHSIEEALLLGTQVLVMSPRPGRIAARFEPGFAHRCAQAGDARAVKTTAEFAELREEIRALIHQLDSVQGACA